MHHFCLQLMVRASLVLMAVLSLPLRPLRLLVVLLSPRSQVV